MNKTVYTGINEDTCILIYSDPDKRRIHGDPDEVADLLSETLTSAIIKDPFLRRPMLRSFWRVRKNTLPEILHYWLDGWPLTILGAGAIAAILYGFGWILHLVGVA